MTNEKNPLTLEWVAETFKSLLDKGVTSEPDCLMKSLLDARAAYEKALQNEGLCKTRVLGSPLSGGSMPCAITKEN